MKIGELARQSGLNASRIRFYEARGLLHAVVRGENGYRSYPPEALQVLRSITGAQRAGFSLEEIRKLIPADLSSWDQEELLQALRRKVIDITAMEEQLRQSRTELERLLAVIAARPADMACDDNARRVLSEVR
ncbi:MULTISPECIES: MerR family transcriptional regulator [unclassified Janthinobacterium]|uniref:MerR family transcriptional regulator n=1 Tax=unclassified Janthinobacterium TaxID=2610881 RepID=UPI00160881BE|nr:MULTISPECIES: MerR family transcriptional regulator [unclassified Janthinobacterium]MBB5371270.1 DNA-binding transcriptional MerR regulator [Janthinobacterium sp. K2C7]MBB5384076.1 DNA-binding transcriptional MerR regulator [Janthinobacterium sp. K2Li3]MBB5389464.1 DNA-binding transcriptional MerR regulator [Janthinobacterium sp. K2E3]